MGEFFMGLEKHRGNDVTAPPGNIGAEAGQLEVTAIIAIPDDHKMRGHGVLSFPYVLYGVIHSSLPSLISLQTPEQCMASQCEKGHGLGTLYIAVIPTKRTSRRDSS